MPAPLVCKASVLVVAACTVRLPLEVDHVDPPLAVMVMLPLAVSEVLLVDA